MTKSGSFHDKKEDVVVLNEVEQNFLRAARAGNAVKVNDFLNAGVNINLCNATGLTALHLASKEGFVEIVDNLLKNGADFDAPTKKGNTALHIASLAGHFEVVRLLLDAGANVNKQSVIGFTPLYMAAQENHLNVVDLLLHRGANQALTTEDGFTPLAVALQQGHGRMVAILLERDSRSRGGMPALHIAARKDDVNAVGLLLNNPEVNVNHQTQQGFTPLHIAAHHGNVNVATPLLQHGADVNFQAKNNITPLHIAAKSNRLEMVQLLLSASALVDCRTRDGLTPLHCAARSGNASLVSVLINAGANPSAKTRNGLTPLHMAAQGNNEGAVRILVSRGASVEDKTGDMLTPLHVAAHCGSREVAQILLENRCDVNARALNGFTPLHIACKRQKIPVVQLLLEYGAQVDIVTESGLSALHVSAFIGSRDIVLLLLQHGANVEQATMRCETALHMAARSHQVEVARALLHHGATPDAKAKDEQTPLHIAVLTGSVDMTQLLLSAGANLNLATRDAYTAMHIAAKEGHHEILYMLLDAGASSSPRTKKGFIPLHLAAKRGRTKAASVLIHAQPKNVNATGQNSLTPLHVATHYNHLSVVQLLLDEGADPVCCAGNGYTPLHIAAKYNHMDVATLLLAQVADQPQSVDAESRNGFTPLHLAAQEGHTDMVSLLLQHGAVPNHQSKNGLVPLHLAAQENHVPVAQILLSAGATASPLTLAGYSPLHTACHFGQVNMVRYLLELPKNIALDINQSTQMGFTPLHLATQQGHSQVVCLLLEMGADSNIRNQQGLTPAHIARRQHYVAIFDILKTVTTTVRWEEEEQLEEVDGVDTLQLQHPDFMQEHPFGESDDEFVPSPIIMHRVLHAKAGGHEDGTLSTANGSLERTGTLSMGMEPKGLSVVENDDIWGQMEYMLTTLIDGNTSEIVTPHTTSVLEASSPASVDKESTRGGTVDTTQIGGDWDLEADNINIIRKPISCGFLVSFIVDARGGLIQAQRRSNLRFLVPPNVVNGPLRIVCRMVHPDRIVSPPVLNDGDGFACRLLELSSVGIRFSAPIVIEIPHYAYLTEKNREIIVLRSENGETWKEHPLDATDQAVHDTVDGYFDSLSNEDELRRLSIHRILSYDLPQYFALITRARQELILIGPEGGVLTSSVVPEVQVQFPQDALHKKIRVGLQVHCVEQRLVTYVMGARVSVSPIVTIEPRRRKFHKPIVLTMPLPKTTGLPGGQVNSANSPTLRLLCSITGGSAPAIWEDITGSSPLSVHKNLVSFTTTVSARVWLVDCPNVSDVVDLAGRVYRESLAVPYMGQFAVYGRRHHPEEAQLRCLCLTDDPVEKTLEAQEGFQLLATGPTVEVLDDHPHWIETSGNLVPVAKTEEQLQLNMRAFQENRLNMLIRVKDSGQAAAGRLAFLRYPRSMVQAAGMPEERVTVLHTVLPDVSPVVQVNGATSILVSGLPQSTDIDALDYSPAPTKTLSNGSVIAGRPVPLPATFGGPETIARSELDLRQVASCLGPSWRTLATHLGLSEADQDFVSGATTGSFQRSDIGSAYAALLLWQERHGMEPSTGTELAHIIRNMGYEDILPQCMMNLTPVTSDKERDMALRSMKAVDGSAAALDTTSGDNIVPSTVRDRSAGHQQEAKPQLTAEQRYDVVMDLRKAFDTGEELPPPPASAGKMGEVPGFEHPLALEQRVVAEKARKPIETTTSPAGDFDTDDNRGTLYPSKEVVDELRGVGLGGGGHVLRDLVKASVLQQPSLSLDTITPYSYTAGMDTTPLTPIPEESLRPSTSQLFSPTTASWDSADFSPSSSLESRSALARLRLRQLLQRFRPSSEESSIDGLGGVDEESVPTHAWLASVLSSDRLQPRSSSESCQEPTTYAAAGDEPYSLLDSSTRSSLADFLRMENFYETGRLDVSEEEARQTANQFDASLRDLVASIQALHNQHLEGGVGVGTEVVPGTGDSLSTGGAGSARLASSGESSIVSQLVSGLSERRVGAGLAEMTAGEATGRLASIVATQMQQLIQSVSSSPTTDSSNGVRVGGPAGSPIGSLTGSPNGGGWFAVGPRGLEESSENGIPSPAPSS